MEMIHKLDLTRVPRELKLMLTIIQLEVDEVKAINWNLYNDLDWGKFERLVIHHRLFPVLYPKLNKIKSVVPSTTFQQIQMLFEQNTFQMLRLSAEMESIGKLFTSEQIPMLVLKGPSLGYDLYGDISLRTSNDLDILISIDQLGQVESLLNQQGYKKEAYFETNLNDWKWRHHHLTYFHPDKQIKLEIHWRLHPGPAKEPSFEELWNRRRMINVTDYPIYTLKREDLFLFLITHGARHGWSRLRWLLDIQQLVKQKLNWHEVMRLLKTYHACRAGGQSLILLKNVLQMKGIGKLNFLMNKRSRKLAQQAVYYMETKVNLHTDPIPLKVSRYHKRHLFSLMSYHQRVIFILSFLYPYPEDFAMLPLPKRLHFLYFPLRPFLWALRKTRDYYVYP